MIGTVMSGGISGLNAYVVKVECDISEGFPGFDLVGMLSSEVREAKERTITALKNCGIQIPSKKVTINLAPANIKKHGTGYDLPIAVSLMMAMGIVETKSVENTLIIGELMLSGEINKVRGVLPIVKLAKDSGIECVIVPKGNAIEAAVIDDVRVIAVNDLRELTEYLNGETIIEPEETFKWKEEGIEDVSKALKVGCDFMNVSGQKVAKRGLEIAAAGMHNVIMVGPPGTGKTMLAKCLPGIMPPMTKEEALEVSSIYSVAGLLTGDMPLVINRPIVEAHHTVTEVALVGGGNTPRPGLVSIAHRGVLFLDEMTEFQKNVLETMRQPLEDKVINVARNGYNVEYPANFMLVGAMNPCPCGMYPDMKKCTCTENMRKRYAGRLSKPLLDRMDLCLQVLRPDGDEIFERPKEEASSEVRKRVLKAREIQRTRFMDDGNSLDKDRRVLFNSQMGVKEIEKYCVLLPEQKELMRLAVKKYDLSARAFHRILKCARTIADLDGSENIEVKHLREALFFKSDVLG